MIGFGIKSPEERTTLQDDCQWWDLRKGLKGAQACQLEVSTPTALPQPGWAVCQHWPCTPWHESESPNTASSVNLLLWCFSQGQSLPEMRQKGVDQHPNIPALTCSCPTGDWIVWWQGITHPEVEEDVKDHPWEDPWRISEPRIYT